MTLMMETWQLSVVLGLSKIWVSSVVALAPWCGHFSLSWGPLGNLRAHGDVSSQKPKKGPEF